MGILCANVFSSILYIVLAIIVLLTMVLIHELGHYVAGRILGFKIEEFSIGFGKAIFQKTNKRGEKISLRIFPLGGYCAFLGENEDDEEEPKDKKKKKSDDKDVVDVTDDVSLESTTGANENVSEKTQNESGNIIQTETTEDEKVVNETAIVEDKKTITLDDIPLPEEAKVEEQKKKEYNPDAFNNQKPWKRIIVYSAGVLFNFLSIFIFSFILLVSYGYDIQKIDGLTQQYYEINNISNAEQIQLKEGDIIWKINGLDVNFATNGTVPALLQSAGADKDVVVTVERRDANGSQMLDITIRLVSEKTTNEAGEEVTKLVSGFTTSSYAFGFFEALGRCFVLAIGFVWAILKGFWQIISGQVALNQLGGPISTISMISSISQTGFQNFLVLLPLLAANLAVFNFLPLPALDGSHVIFTTIEWIRRKPINRKIENYIHFFGLLALLAFVVVIDIIHMIAGG